MMNSCDAIVLLLFGLAIVGQSKPLDGGCGPGEYRDPQLMCHDCPPHTYSSARDEADHCDNCSQRCFDNRNAVVLHSCNSTHDMICQCKNGLFALSNRSLCKRHDTCPENCLKQQGSASSNTVCYDPCPTTTSVNELSVQSSTGSTAVITIDQSTDSPPNLNSSLLNLNSSLLNLNSSLLNLNSSLLTVTTSSSNETASDNFLRILLPVVITVSLVIIIILVIIVSIRYREKICECLNKLRRTHIYQRLPVNGGNLHPAVNHPPQPPHRNASLENGNDRDGLHRQLNGYRSDQRPATPSFERVDVASDGVAPVSFQDLPPHDGSVLPEVLPNEALVPVPNDQTLPLESETAGEASSDEAAAMLPESRHHGCSSRPLSYPVDLLPEGDYAQARLLSTDIHDSLIGHGSDDLSANASNSEDTRGSQTMLGLEDHQSLPPGPGMQDNRRTLTRPCARVPPLVILQPNRNPQANNLQHAPVHLQQHPQMIHQQQYQPINPPDVPNQIVDVDSVYSVESMSQGNELT